MKIGVVGTDTDVGKTLISAWLCGRTRWPYWKPIQSGERDTAVVASLSGVETFPEAYLFSAPVSPHEAAKRMGTRIDLDTISLPATYNLVIEGAGGVLTPLNEENLFMDLWKRWKIPVLIVARNTLGTLNHTLLTLEALRTREIPIRGVVLNGGPPNACHRDAIQHYGKISVLAELPMFSSPTEILKRPCPFEYQS